MAWDEIGFIWHLLGFSVLALIVLAGLAATAVLLCVVLDLFGPKENQ